MATWHPAITHNYLKSQKLSRGGVRLERGESISLGAMMTRRLRGRRTSRSGIALQERDVALLLLMARCGRMTCVQVKRDLPFPSIDRCCRTLRRLFDAKLIDVTILSSTECNVWTLTREGLDVVCATHPDLEHAHAMPSPLQRSALAHALLITDAALYVHALVRAEGGSVVALASGNAAPLRTGSASVRPDALATLRMGPEVIRIALEADLGTEGARIIDAKCRAYAPHVARGAVDEIWFVVDAPASRNAQIETAACATGIAASVRVMARAHVVARPVRRPGPRAGSDVPSESAAGVDPDSVVNSDRYAAQGRLRAGL